jgi:hypothetical protein
MSRTWRDLTWRTNQPKFPCSNSVFLIHTIYKVLNWKKRTVNKEINKEYYKLVSLSNVYDMKYSTFISVWPSWLSASQNPTNLFGYTKYLISEPGQLMFPINIVLFPLRLIFDTKLKLRYLLSDMKKLTEKFSPYLTNTHNWFWLIW